MFFWMSLHAQERVLPKETLNQNQRKTKIENFFCNSLLLPPQSTRLFRLLNTGGRLTTEGIDTVFENVYNFLRLCHLLLQSSFSPPRRIGSETSKKVYWVRNVREDYSKKFTARGSSMFIFQWLFCFGLNCKQFGALRKF